MALLVDVDKLIADDVITEPQGDEITTRAKRRLIQMGVDVLTVGGILLVAGGLIAFLGTPLSVAGTGLAFLMIGLFVLWKKWSQVDLFGNAGVLIGAGMLLGGGTIEVLDKLETFGPWIVTGAGALVTLIALARWRAPQLANRFVIGGLLAMGGAVHVTGLLSFEVAGWLSVVFSGYVAALLFAVGTLINVRLITALAIIPIAQMLDTGTFYWHAIYAFYAPETTLQIIQMALVIGVCVVALRRVDGSVAPHLKILMLMAFILMNMNFWVGSLWTDYVGEHMLGYGWSSRGDTDYSEWWDVRNAFRERTWVITDWAAAVAWAIVLTGLMAWFAKTAQRGLLNVTLTFAAIHLYTQCFELFGSEPLVFVGIGLTALPAAWGIKQVDRWAKTQSA
ncbi:MAG: hypothetical protein ACPG5U_01305 [Planktomarina sp.]